MYLKQKKKARNVRNHKKTTSSLIGKSMPDWKKKIEDRTDFLSVNQNLRKKSKTSEKGRFDLKSVLAKNLESGLIKPKKIIPSKLIEGF